MNHKTNYISYLLLCLLCWSCSTTKNLPEGAVLYTGISKIEIQNEDVSEAGRSTVEELEAALDYPPNNALLGSSSVRVPFPFGLWVYNAFVNKEGKLSRWIFNKLAAKPVLISTVNPDVRVKVVRNLLNEYGYFNGATAYELVPDKKDPRKAKIAYQITMNPPYTIDSIYYVPMRNRVDSLLPRVSGERLIRKGDNFNVVRLQEERERIADRLRDNGYYYFRPEYMIYQADTTITPGKVSLRIVPKEGMPRNALIPWKLGNVDFYLNGYRNEQPTDSIRYKDLTIHY